MRIIPDIINLDQYIKWIKNAGKFYKIAKCIYCGLSSRIVRHGYYYRQADRENSGSSSHNPVAILRFKCNSCNRTMNALPQFMAPRRWYNWNIQQIVIANLSIGKTIFFVSRLLGIPARSTIKRWLHWADLRYLDYRFLMVEKSPQLGLEQNWQDLWSAAIEIMPLSKWMMYLQERQAFVP